MTRRASLARQLGTHPQLRRLMWALNRLRSGQPLKATDLAAEFEVNVRTAYRDIDFLRDEWRVPLEFDRAKNSYRLTEPLLDLPAVTISEGELLSLFFAEKVVAQYRGTPFEADLKGAFRKIEDLLPGKVSVSPSTLDDYLSFDPGPLHSPDAAIFRDVLSAQRLRRALLVRYRSLSSNRTRQRRIHPYHVFNHRGDWYLAAWDEPRKAVRIFALHRIRRATLTTEAYTVPKSFSFRRYMADAFAIQKGDKPVHVAIRFAPRQARWIRERRWHPTARVQEQLDGGLVLHLRIAETSEIRRFVLQFGQEAEVLAPASLRKEMAKDLAVALAAYRPKP
ncbi:MAG TPA: WYL domain-containing protein [Vicinamibacteria bacterium]|nr:WYL domain-containing protein [Vicinamibacteria bacterium]